MPNQGCHSMDVCRGSRQSGSKGKLTLKTIVLIAVQAKLQVFLDKHVGTRMSIPWLVREEEGKHPEIYYQPLYVLQV